MNAMNTTTTLKAGAILLGVGMISGTAGALLLGALWAGFAMIIRPKE